MPKNRLEAFSDGVIAILITIMVLELKVPHDPTFAGLFALWPVFLSYVLSFIYLGIYWNNHHHMLHAAKHVSGAVLWWNLILLFWLSLVPFATSWMGENHFGSLPMALYGVILLMAAISYFFLQYFIICADGETSLLKVAVGGDLKGKLSPFIYIAAVIFAFIAPWVSGLLYVLVALMWLIPDPRIEKVINHRSH
jgi:uncharacterized membrane protein